MRLPVATDLVSRDGTVIKDARLKNAFASNEGEALKRPGTTMKASGMGNLAQGGIDFNSMSCVVSNDTLYFYNSVFSLISSAPIS